MTVETIILCGAVVCLMACIVAQRVYIHMLEQKIDSTRSESRLHCGDCENLDYILKEVE